MDIHREIPFAARRRVKAPFDIHEVLRRIENTVRGLPPSLHAALYADGFTSLFQHVVASILAARAPDAAVKLGCENLFRWAPTAERIDRLKASQVEALIAVVPDARTKATRVKEIARLAREKYGGELPARERVLRALPGVGVTCANLVLGLVAGQEKLCVGSHVARVTKRWGVITATSTAGIATQLGELVPREKWRHVGEWLMVFGAHVCTKESPACARCPVVAFCRQVGVS